MHKLILTILLFFVIPSGDKDYQLVKLLPVKVKYFTTDHLQNVYVVQSNNELVKYNKEGESMVTYSDKGYGGLKAVDCNNPLKVLLFYPDFARVVITDNYLAPQRVIDLSDVRIERAGAVCLSNDNKIWVYDERAYKLRKIDQGLQVVQESEDLSQVIGPDIEPTYLVARDNRIFLNDSSKGIYVFDLYAKYQKRLPISDLQRFQVRNKKLYFYKDKHLQSYDMHTLERDTIALPNLDEVKEVQVQGDRLYLLRKNQLFLYRHEKL